MSRRTLAHSACDNKTTSTTSIQFKTLLNKVRRFKNFVYGGALHSHEELLKNYFKAGKIYSSGIVEGLNLRINLCMRKAYGYRSFKLL